MKRFSFKNVLLAIVIAFSGVAVGCDEEKDSDADILVLLAMSKGVLAGTIDKGVLGATHETYGTLIISDQDSFNSAISDYLVTYQIELPADGWNEIKYRVDISGIDPSSYGLYYVYFVIYTNSGHDSGCYGVYPGTVKINAWGHLFINIELNKILAS